MPTVDFRRIRSHRGSQQTGFEELTRQLVLAAPPLACTRIEHRGPGADGGVEILVWFSDESCWGWQSKYFVDSLGPQQFRQIRESYAAALASFPTLTKYFVALPRNLSGAGGTGINTQRQQWDEFVIWAEDEASKHGREVEIVLWDESEFVRRLTQHDPTHAGMLLYWFETTVLTKEWFLQHLEVSIADLAERYLPRDHVDVAIQSHLDTITRRRGYIDAVNAMGKALETSLRAAEKLTSDTDFSTEEQDVAQAIVIQITQISLQYIAIDWVGAPSISLEALQQAIRDLWGGAEMQILREATGTYGREPSEQVRRRYNKFINFHRALSNLVEAPRGIEALLLKRPILLVVGEAGSGKSHALAHAADIHLHDEGPALLFLGQHFAPGDPRDQICSRVGLRSVSFDTFLGALQAAAEAFGKPAVIFIDALNEAHQPTSWRNNLAGLAVEVARFSRVALVVSCRSVYERYCIPTSWPYARVVHHGFEDNSAEAAKVYLDNHGIARPAVPFLNPEFTNPLFLSTTVRALEAQGIKAFPLGLSGISQVFELWINSIEDNLVRKGYRRIAPGDGLIAKGLSRFAEQMAIEKTDALPLIQTRDLFEKDLANYALQGPHEELMWRLIEEGVLRRDPSPDGMSEVVTFTFQRFCDHFIADAVIRLNDTPRLLAAALKPGGDFSHFCDDTWHFAGVVEALMVQVPEKLGVELPRLEPTFVDDVHLDTGTLLESLRWRAPAATGPSTVELIEELVREGVLQEHDLFDALLHICSHPKHALNAEYLHNRLAALTMSERDASWSAYLFDAIGRDTPVATLVDWAWTADTSRAEKERVELVAIALGWCLSTSDRRVRDQATKALAALIYRSPHIASYTIQRFADVDDAYIRERILAAAYGALLHVRGHHTTLECAAQRAFKMVFVGDTVERHAFVRYFARRLIEIASIRSRLPHDVDLSRCHSLCLSEPITSWPSADDIRLIQATAESIVSSVIGYLGESGEVKIGLAGDFGRYTMGSIENLFSAEIRSSSAPWTTGAEKASFWREVEGVSEKVADLAQAARDARDAFEQWEREEGWSAALRTKSEGEPTLPEKALELLDRFARAETALLGALPQVLADRYRSNSPYPNYDDDKVASFNLAQAQRWIVQRAIDLGWNAEKHGSIDVSRNSWDRRDHSVERLGKKYQWIAFAELIGYLGDYHWYIDWGRKPAVLTQPSDFREFDIDPSFLRREGDAHIHDARVPHIRIPVTDFQAESVDEALAWTETIADLPHIPDIIEAAGPDGRRWWMVEAWRRDQRYMEKLQTAGPMRTGQFFVDLVLVKTSDVASLHSRIQNSDIVGSDIVERDRSRSMLFGEHTSDLLDGEPTDWLNRKYEDVEIGDLVMSLSPYRGEYDQSGSPQGSFAIPTVPIIQALSLSPESPYSPAFLSVNGRISFIDTRYTRGDDGAVIIDAALLEPVLASLQLTPVWIFRAEKDGGHGRDMSQDWDEYIDRRGFGGMWWKDCSGWQGSTWASPNSWNARS